MLELVDNPDNVHTTMSHKLHIATKYIVNIIFLYIGL